MPQREAAIDLLLKFLRHLHMAITLFLLLGWLMPFQSAAVAHVIVVPAMILQWKLNQGTCLLTNFENWLKGSKVEKSAQQGQFIKGLLARCFNPLPKDATIKFWLYVILWGGFTISALKLILVWV